MTHRILVLLGHPDSDSLCAHLAQTYADTARAAGHEVELIRLGELQFDPVLRQGYRRPHPLEDDLVAAQQAIRKAGHLVFVYPIWWGAMPALLKGFIDRIFLPGFAFKYRKGGSRVDQLLAGRSAELIVTLDTPLWYYKWFQGMPGHRQMKKAILEFSGIAPVRIENFGPVISSSEHQRRRWSERVAALARRALPRTGTGLAR